MANGVRKTIYLSRRKDLDLIEYSLQLNHYDFSHAVKSLMRDGIEYREKHAQIDKVIQSNTMSHTPNIQQNQPPPDKQKTDFSDVELTRKEVSDDELERRLDF